MAADHHAAVEERIAEFDQALSGLERAQRSEDPRALARAVEQARIAKYTVSRYLEHLQPTADQWAMIEDRMDRLSRWLAPYD